MEKGLSDLANFRFNFTSFTSQTENDNVFSRRNVNWTTATEIREEASYPWGEIVLLGLFWRTEMPRNLKSALNVMNIFFKIRLLLVHIASGTLFSHLQAHWVLLCTQSKAARSGRGLNDFLDKMTNEWSVEGFTRAK